MTAVRHTVSLQHASTSGPARPHRASLVSFLLAAIVLSVVGADVRAGDAAPLRSTITAAASREGTAGRGVELARAQPAAEVRNFADWVARLDDSHGPFVIVDKKNARVYVFDSQARLQGHSPVLLGAAKGDDSVPGIGERPIRDIKPHERTTPAGRFVGESGRNVQGEDIVWVDYDAAVSMHRVRATNPRERRLERLATPTAADNRISYGCINVPAAFFDAYVSPLFGDDRQAVVYVLPETRSLRAVFSGYDGADDFRPTLRGGRAKEAKVAAAP
ncbi:MAG: hypothetical protein M3Z31_08715 [Pseudomonadota bacterium]|nr:hypothetical protein [Pseudomonadota bacterium]